MFYSPPNRENRPNVFPHSLRVSNATSSSTNANSNAAEEANSNSPTPSLVVGTESNGSFAAVAYLEEMVGGSP